MEPPFYFAYKIEGQEFGTWAGSCVSDHMALAGAAGMAKFLSLSMLSHFLGSLCMAWVSHSLVILGGHNFYMAADFQ